MRLVIFDVDGTLTRSTTVDTLCYARALAQELAVEIDTNWLGYRHTTDAGILGEVLERHGIAETPDLVEAIRRRFLRLLSEAITSDPECCREVPGARTIVELLRRTHDVRLAIATGAWADSAHLKLRRAGIDVERLPFASSDDSPSREEILRIARGRTGVTGSVTYVGDAPWDVSAARSLGFRFIGIACDGDGSRLISAGASTVVTDFTDTDAFVARVLTV
jgi:phosphoglycolate phosphatase-like HAD superfamily hydrolase